MTRLVFHPEARLEYLAAAEYYEQRKVGLGARFSVEAAIARILDAPGRWTLLEGGVHRCLTHTFPFGVIYTLQEDHILILAVMHCSRVPGYWKRRGA